MLLLHNFESGKIELIIVWKLFKEFFFWLTQLVLSSEVGFVANIIALLVDRMSSKSYFRRRRLRTDEIEIENREI